MMDKQGVTVEIYDQKLVAGLNWSVLDPFRNRHQQIDEWIREGESYGVSYQVNDGRGVIEIFGRSNNADDENCGSVAALFAQHPQVRGRSALGIFEIPNEGFDDHVQREAYAFVVAVENGQVVIDACVRGGEVSRLRNEAQGKIDTSYEVFGSGESAGSVDHVLSLEDLLSKKWRKGRKVQSEKLRKLSSGRTQTFVIGAVGLAAVCAMAWVGYSLWVGHLDDLERERLEEENSPEVLYRQSAQAYMEAPQIPLAGVLSAMHQALGKVPVVMGGWEMKHASCGGDGCSVRWARISNEGGTLEDFRKRAPKNWSNARWVSQTELESDIPYQVESVRLDRGGWPKFGEWADRLVSNWQDVAAVGWSAAFDLPKQQAIPPELYGQKEAMRAVEQHPDAIWSSDIEVKEMPWWMADLSDKAMPLRNALLTDQATIVEPVNLTVSASNITFSLKGRIHVQK